MKEYYVKLLKETIEKFRPLITNAPVKKGYNKTFGTPISSQYDVMRARDNCIKDIVVEAREVYGIDLGIRLKEEEEYESPFVEPKGD